MGNAVPNTHSVTLLASHKASRTFVEPRIREKAFSTKGNAQEVSCSLAGHPDGLYCDLLVDDTTRAANNTGCGEGRTAGNQTVGNSDCNDELAVIYCASSQASWVQHVYPYASGLIRPLMAAHDRTLE
jgi:hypothetical protein